MNLKILENVIDTADNYYYKNDNTTDNYYKTDKLCIKNTSLY